jgi:hypothetical protein
MYIQHQGMGLELNDLVYEGIYVNVYMYMSMYVYIYIYMYMYSYICVIRCIN